MKPCQKIEGNLEKEDEPKPQEKPEEGQEPEEEEKSEERLIRSLQDFQEDIHNRHLSSDDLFRAVEELDEIRKVRNKLIVTPWKANRSHLYPYLM